YHFNIDLVSGFINNPEEKNLLEKTILRKVRDLKNHSGITAYSFSYDFTPYFTKPLLFYQKQAYVNWLISLISEIKKIAPEKAVILEVPVSHSINAELQKLQKYVPADAFGLI